MNANIVHKWVRLAEAGELTEQTPAFIPIPVRGNIAAINAQIIDIEIVRGEAKVNLRWPTQDSAACGAWLCEWLR